MVLIDVSSEPEVPVYERLEAGPWIDGTDRIDIHATVEELHAAGDLGDIPLVVVTAGIIEDEWLATVPKLAARAQVAARGPVLERLRGRRDRLRALRPSGRPRRGARRDRAVVEAARSAIALAPCDEVFALDRGATCVPPGTVPELVPA